MEQRRELAYERHTLLSRYWEPQPDEEELEKQIQERMAAGDADDTEELPFE